MPELSSQNRHVDETSNWTGERRRKPLMTQREPAPTTHRITQCFCIVRKGNSNKSNYNTLTQKSNTATHPEQDKEEESDGSHKF